MRRGFVFAGLALLTACTAPQGLYLAQNNYRVYPSVDPGRFEVVSRPGAGGDDFFCAAADYSWRRLGGGAADRVVVTRPVGFSTAQPGARSVEFQLAPRSSVRSNRSIVADVSRRGSNYTIGHALTFCRSTTGVSFFD